MVTASLWRWCRLTVARSHACWHWQKHFTMYSTGIPLSLPREFKKKSDIGTAKEESQVRVRQLKVLLTYNMPEKLFPSLSIEQCH